MNKGGGERREVALYTSRLEVVKMTNRWLQVWLFVGRLADWSLDL